MKAEVYTEATMTEHRYLQIPQCRACSLGKLLVLTVDLEFESTFFPVVCHGCVCSSVFQINLATK